MSEISRRTALARGGQAVAAAAVISVVPNLAAEAAEGEAELFKAIASLKGLMGEYLKARDAADAAYKKAEADPDKPEGLAELSARLDAEGVKYDHRQICQEYHQRTMKHRARFGWREPYDRFCHLGKQGRKAAQQIFALPARTLKGAFAKLQLANWLRKQFEEPDDWADHGEWELASQHDFERLLGRVS